MNFENAKNKLKEYAQEHILDYYDELNDSQKEAHRRDKLYPVLTCRNQ